MSALPDQQHRDLALDVGSSFIVQAPAGSGKTELLALRYLRLLSICNEPEEVLAITFTRKAASEMKDRIIKALSNASAAGPASSFEDPLKENRHRHACAALIRADQCQWNILQNPGRLRIQTIDSFCYSLASRIPLLSRLGGSPNVSEDVQPCFDMAITRTLALLNDGGELARDIAKLLEHLDNNVTTMERLLSDLLRNRDQWLPYILDINSHKGIDREYLLSSLNELICEALLEVQTYLSNDEKDIVELLNHAAAHLPADHHRYIVDYKPLTGLPDCVPDAFSYWLLLEAIMLTKEDGEWRVRIDKNQGFPATINGDKDLTALCKTRKQLWLTLRTKLAGNEDLRQALAYLRLLPQSDLATEQWEILTALSRVLRHLGMQLQLAFRNLKMVDHVQVSAAALDALGSEEQPTDLALALDHQIQHILVDEFQDTSRLQTNLLERLTVGWEPADGRTLFLVGDAMQSVYGFRNANVGIYLTVREEGLGQLSLEPLVLKSNFRSQSTIVEWVNRVFSSAFPIRENPSRGAVAYTSSTASLGALEDWGVTTDLITCEQADIQLARDAESDLIVTRVQNIKLRDPAGSVAILVRSRSHLATLIPKLRDAGIHWQATDIDKLDSLPIIDDLLSLTRALLNRGDRIAWLSILRAPWCGLSISDLHVLALAAGDGTIWSALQRFEELSDLSADGRMRLEDFITVLGYANTLRDQLSLHQLVESAWRLLGGPSTARSAAEQRSVVYFLELLRRHEQSGSLPCYENFSEKLATAFVPSAVTSEAEGTVHLMTMHKAKGLEFDHVIMPALGAEPRNSPKSLLQWHERINRLGDPRLFIAALPEAGTDDDQLYNLLRYEEKRKSEYEDVRLLYIATTRARKSAHLTATLIRNKEGQASPRKGSLLHYIWPRLEELGDDYCKSIALEYLCEQKNSLHGESLSQSNPAVSGIKRFSSPLRLSDNTRRFIHITSESRLESQDEASVQHDINSLEHDLDTAVKAAIGTLIHQGLENLVNTPNLLDSPLSIASLKQYWHRQLSQFEIDADSLANALQFIQSSLENCLSKKEVSWIFDSGLQDSRTEAPISRVFSGKIQHFVIDRTFVDRDGVRWVIDYKTAAPTPEHDIDEFITEQCRMHSQQLLNYRQLFSQMESRPIRTALLFTSLPRLVEI